MENVLTSFYRIFVEFEFSLKYKMADLLAFFQSRPRGFPVQNDSSGRSPGDEIDLVDDVTVS